MTNRSIPTRNTQALLARRSTFVAVSLLASLVAAMANAGTTFPPPPPPGLNVTQLTMYDAIIATCPLNGNEEEFKDRCDAVVGAAASSDPAQATDALQSTAPEQAVSQGTQAARVAAGRGNEGAVVSNRLAMIRAGAMAAIQIDFGGERVYANRMGDLRAVPGEDARDSASGLGAADSATSSGRLGVYLNGAYHFGDVDSTTLVRGFDYDNGGVTVGADYRVLDTLVLGGAFTWWRTDAEFSGNAGSTDSDRYTGTIYGSFFPIDGLYFDVLGSYGGINYDTKRHISYSIPGDVVNTTAKGSPDGRQWAVNGGLGYDFDVAGLSFGPYAQATYRRLHVDGYDESDPAGWAVRFGSQTVESLTTTLGGRIAYPISTDFAVFTPQLRGAWWHEFEDDARLIASSFVGAVNPQTFGVFTDKPDRDYGNIGVSLSATLPQGFSAFADYDVLLGYKGVTSNRFTFGVRAEFF